MWLKTTQYVAKTSCTNVSLCNAAAVKCRCVSFRHLCVELMTRVEMEDVIEYNFTTQPQWISDAIEFTDVGIELNFKKLSAMCGQSKLPNRLCIILEGTQSTSVSASMTEIDNQPEGIVV